MWKFSCKCGKEFVAALSKVRKGKPKSCGCLQRERHLIYEDGKLYLDKFGKRSELKAMSSCNGRRYLTFSEFGKTKYVHRAIYELHHGSIPPGMVIDHINRNTLDNRIENLRLVSHAQNLQNQKMRTDNTVGVKNVTYSVRMKRYCFVRKVNDKRVSKYFANKSQALEYARSFAHEHNLPL
jgi:hypothetical protein